MSRIVWMGVGAAGGIYLYRRGNRTWDEAKERGLAGNAAVLASSASTMLNHAKRALAEAQDAKDIEIAEDRMLDMPTRVPVGRPSYYEQRELLGDPQSDPANVRMSRRWQEPQLDGASGAGPEYDGGGERVGSRSELPRSRGAVGRSRPVRFITQRNRFSA